MPWQKGQSGNPRGRRRNGNTAKDWFCKLGGENGKQYAERLHGMAMDPKSPDALRALALIAGYVWGKPKEIVEIDLPRLPVVSIVHKQAQP